MRYCQSFFLFLLFATTTHAAEVKNLKTGQQGEKGFAQYDLAGKPGEKQADVTVFIELVNDRYPADKLSLSGDFGTGVKVGVGKKIFWDVLKDMPAGFEGEAVWDVEVSGTPVGAKQGSSASPVGGGNSGKGEADKALASPLRDSATGMEFVPVPAGCFSPEGKQVCLDAFHIGKYEVTQGQYKRIMGSNPSHFSSCGDDCPVERVSWNDAQDFISKLNSQSGKRYRLPTEAEWHYACTSGGKNEEYCGGNNIDALAWYYENNGHGFFSIGSTHPAGQKQPNGLGIYDMSGNVFEWVQDWYGNSYPSGVSNPQGPSSGQYHMVRGGSWLDWPLGVLASRRARSESDGRDNLTGFRLVSSSQD